MMISKTELAQALGISGAKLWREVSPFYGEFPESFKYAKLMHRADARKILELFRYTEKEIEIIMKRIKI